MKKRLIAPILLMLLVLTACGGGQDGNGSKHPYRWKEKRDGSIELIIKNAPEDGYDWGAEEAEDGFLQIERTDIGGGDRAVFSLTGEGPVGGTAILTCRRENAPGDTSFEIWLQVDRSDKGRLKVTQTEYREFPPVETVGVEGMPSCSWYSDTDGTSKLYLNELYSWRTMGYDETILSIGLPAYGESGCTYTLTGLAVGETSLLLYDLTADYGFQLTAAVAEDLSVTLSNGEAGTFKIPTQQIPGMQEVTDYIGELPIPSEYRISECGSGDWNGIGGETDYAVLSLYTNQEAWALYATKNYSMTDFIALFLDGYAGGTRTKMSVNGYPAILFGEGEQHLLFWSDDQKRSFCLCAQSDTPAPEELLAAANGLYGAPKDGE